MSQQGPVQMTAAQAIVECLRRAEIEHVFCVPGESYLPVLDALHDEGSIEVISARHEGGAAFMAEGYAKATLRPGVVLATRGVGATNLSIGVHTAYQDSTPMIVLLGQVNSKFRGREGFQEVDLDQYFAPIAKWAVEVKDPERMTEIMQKAIRLSVTGRPGPVVISLPEDVLPVEEEFYFLDDYSIPAPRPARAELEAVEQLFKWVKQPLIIAGGGVRAAQAEQSLVQFAEHFNLPVATAFRRHDVFPHDHPLFAGHLGLGTPADQLASVKEADCILAIGTRLSEVTSQDYRLIDWKKPLIHIDIDEYSLGKVYPPTIAIQADAKEALLDLQQLSITPTWQHFAQQVNRRYVETSRLEPTAKDVINKHIIASIAEKVPSDTLFTVDAGNFAGWLHAYYPFKEPQTFIGPTSGAMGYGLPAALGAKLAFPHKKVISLSGDGGFMMTVQELETAVRYQIPVISLVFNNAMYGTIRMHQEMHYPGKVIATDLGEVSFEHLAKSLGVKSMQVDSIEGFNEAFEEALQCDEPVCIEILTERQNIAVSGTIDEIRERSTVK